MAEERTAREERSLLMQAAEDLCLELRRITEPVNKIVNHLIGDADSLMIAAADEKEEARGTVARKLTYKKLGDKAGPAPTKQVMDSKGNVTEKRQKKCGTCHQPGHTARTCKRK